MQIPGLVSQRPCVVISPLVSLPLLGLTMHGINPLLPNSDKLDGGSGAGAQCTRHQSLLPRIGAERLQVCALRMSHSD